MKKRGASGDFKFFKSNCKYIHHYQTISIIDLKSGNIINEIDILKKISEYKKVLLESYTKLEIQTAMVHYI